MMYLLTGGSASGKSRLAEELCLNGPAPHIYLAAMRPEGEDGRERIERHRRMRAGKGFVTIERYTDLASLRLPDRGSVLLECVGNLTANEMFGEDGFCPDPFSRVMDGVEALRRQSALVVVVSVEVGSDSRRYDETTMAYIRAVGRINAALASEADAAAEVVAGIPLMLKGVFPA